MKNIILRGRILSFIDSPQISGNKKSYKYIEDGALLIENGKITESGTFRKITLKKTNKTIVYDHKENLILPGFVDPHIHYPQVQVIGSYAKNLLEWLNKYTFVEEQKYNNQKHAERISKLFFDQLINHGTTTASVFCTVNSKSVEAFFKESHKRNMLMIAGKVMMDRNAPKKLLDTPQSSYDESNFLIKKWHGKGRQKYAITPRFAITSSNEQLALTETLLNENPECYFQTHLSENKDEVRLAKKLFPQYRDYTDIYEKFNFLGPKSLFAHCIYLSNREIKKIGNSKSVLIFCPTSNLFLGSGMFNLKHYLNKSPKLRLAIATDIGGGTSYSMLKTMDEACKISHIQDLMINPFQSFYQITLGNARALSLEHKIGSLSKNNDADIVVLNSKSTSAMKLRMETVKNLAEELFILQTMGDDRAIKEVYIKGKPSKSGLKL